MYVFEYVMRAVPGNGGGYDLRDARVKLLREMYDRYVKADDRHPFSFEEFPFTNCVGVGPVPGTLVMTPDPHEPDGPCCRYGIVVGPNYHKDETSVRYASGTECSWCPDQIRESDVPPDIMGLVEQKMREKCPLKAPACAGED